MSHNNWPAGQLSTEFLDYLKIYILKWFKVSALTAASIVTGSVLIRLSWVPKLNGSAMLNRPV